MKITIANNGGLWLERGRAMTRQLCPFNANPTYPCGHWCPLFTAEEIPETVVHPLPLPFPTKTPQDAQVIPACAKVILRCGAGTTYQVALRNFTDERVL